MKPKLRKFFDEQLAMVLPQLPQRVHDLLDEIPLVIDDYPSREIMQRVNIRRREHLCGLYTGVPLTERSIDHSGILSDVIHIFREGILTMSVGENGKIDIEELRKQIRITILHEFGHHHGLDEEELEELGY